MTAASSATFSLRIAVPASFGPGSVAATVNVNAAVIDSSTANNSATARTTITSPARLIAVKTLSSRTSNALTYEIVIRNDGPAMQVDDPASAEMTDTLPPELVLTSASVSLGTVSTSGNTVSWNGSLAAGESVTVTINATIAPGVPGGTAISNQATVFYDADGSGANESSEGSRPSLNAAPGPTVVAAALATIPTLDLRALLLLAAILGGIALYRLR